MSIKQTNIVFMHISVMISSLYHIRQRQYVELLDLRSKAFNDRCSE